VTDLHGKSSQEQDQKALMVRQKKLVFVHLAFEFWRGGKFFGTVGKFSNPRKKDSKKRGTRKPL